MSEFLAEYSKIPGIDVVSALSFCGDENNLLDIATTFARTGDKKIEELQKALYEVDLRSLTIKAHALKSAAALIGATELSSEAKELEMYARDENYLMAKEHAPKVLDDLEAYVYSVMEVVANCSDIDPEEAESKQDAVVGMSSLEKGAEHSALIIGHGQNFTLSALAQSMQDEGFTVTIMDPEKDFVQKYENTASTFILFLGEYTYQGTDMLERLKKICAGKRRLLYLVGTKQEIHQMLTVLEITAVSGIFLKPLDHQSFIYKAKQGISTFSRYRIFVVDDDEMYLTGLSDWLGKKYRVETLNSGEAALEAIQESLPDLIMLDYEMPGISGPEVLRVLKEEETTKDIPIIFLTGMDDKESIMNVMSYHPEDYLLKSKGPKVILDAVDSYFEEKKKKEEEELAKKLAQEAEEIAIYPEVLEEKGNKK